MDIYFKGNQHLIFFRQLNCGVICSFLCFQTCGSLHEPYSLTAGSCVWPTLCEHVTSARDSCPNPVTWLGYKNLLGNSSGSLAFETGIAVTHVVSQAESTGRGVNYKPSVYWVLILGIFWPRFKKSPHNPATAACVLQCLCAQRCLKSEEQPGSCIGIDISSHTPLPVCFSTW